MPSRARVSAVFLAVLLPLMPSPALSKDGHRDNSRDDFAKAAQKAAQDQAEQVRKEAERLQKEADRRHRESETAVKQQQQEAQKAAASSGSSPSLYPSAPTPTRQQADTSSTERSTGNDARNGGEDRNRVTAGSSSGAGSQSSKNDDKSDKRDRNDKSDKNDNEKHDAAKLDDDAPPATIKAWLDRTFGSEGAKKNENKQNSDTPDADHDEPVRAQMPASTFVKPTAAGQDRSKNSNSAAANKPKVGPVPPKIEFPDFKSHEVLAINASAKSIEQAKSMGFKVKAITPLPSLGLSVTTLEPPGEMDALAAQEKLQASSPASDFALNREYTIYHTATGTLPGTERARTEKRPDSGERMPGSACSGDHCFGGQVMGWHKELSQCSKGLKIGIIDTDVDLNHPVFANRKFEIVHVGSGQQRGPNWHGTGVTALLAGDGLGGVQGLAPEASYFIADAFHAGVNDQPASDTLSMLRAFEWLEKKDVKIINLSLSGPPDDLMKNAIDRLSEKGVVLVAAAGNEGPAAKPSYPAAYDNVIAVTAVNKDLAGYRYANRGDYIDVSAPGVSVWTAMPGGSGDYHSGTSFAAPFMTAAVASVYNRLPGKTPSDVVRAIKYKDLGDPGVDSVYGHGLVLAPDTCSGSAVASAGALAPQETSSATRATSAQSSEVLPWLGLVPGN